VRPPKNLRSGARCVVASLGECGDRKCGNYRLGAKTSRVRPTFLDFCVSHIRRVLSADALRAGIVFCSLGSGQLLFDWELLETLTSHLGTRLRVVQLIDKDYSSKGRSDAHRAQRTFAGWFVRQRGCHFRSFSSISDLFSWVKLSGEAAHVLLDCDAVGARKRLDIHKFRKTTLRMGGICLVLSNPAKRTAIVKQVGNDGNSVLEVVDQQYYSHGKWSDHKPSKSRGSSCSSSSSLSSYSGCSRSRSGSRRQRAPPQKDVSRVGNSGHHRRNSRCGRHCRSRSRRMGSKSSRRRRSVRRSTSRHRRTNLQIDGRRDLRRFPSENSRSIHSFHRTRQ